MTTRAVARASLGLRTGQPFFRRAGAAQGTATGGSTTTLVDTAFLLQANDFWNGQWLYLPATDVARQISDFDSATKTLTFVEPTTVIVAGTKYEIWNTFSPHEVNVALNQVLRAAWPDFFNYNEGYLVIQRGVGVSYSLSNVSPAIKHLFQLWVEVGLGSVVGTSAGGVAQNRLKDTGTTFTSDDIGKTIRVYYGTSIGDYRTISALVDAHTVQVSQNFTSVLDTTTLYRMVDERIARLQFAPVLAWGIDKFNNPTVMRLSAHPVGYEGYLMRLRYESEYAPFTTDADDITCPQEYLELAALARLFLEKMGSTPEQQLKSWETQQRSYAAAAEEFGAKHRFQHLDSQYTDDSVRFARPLDYPF